MQKDVLPPPPRHLHCRKLFVRVLVYKLRSFFMCQTILVPPFTAFPSPWHLSSSHACNIVYCTTNRRDRMLSNVNFGWEHVLSDYNFHSGDTILSKGKNKPWKPKGSIAKVVPSQLCGSKKICIQQKRLEDRLFTYTCVVHYISKFPQHSFAWLMNVFICWILL